MLSDFANDNRHLLARTGAEVGSKVHLVLPGAAIRGWLKSIDDGGATAIITTTDTPPLTWAVNLRQLIAAGRVGADAQA